MYALEALNGASRATAALSYYDLGWHVIPLHDKRPVTNWLTDPRLHPDTLRIFFEDHDFNIGITMGKHSGLVALDLDGPAGQELLTSRAIEANMPYEALYNTAQFTTPNGGLRLLYQYDPTIATRSIRLEGKEAIRIMSDGTQTVAPPSTIDGRPYVWGPHDHLAVCPTAFFHFLATRPTSTRPTTSATQHDIDPVDKIHRARKYIAACEPAIAGQGGHNQTFKLAVKLIKGFALNRWEAFAILAEWNERCQPPWSDEELEHKLNDALKLTAASGSLL